jgi:hypothetical protein
MVVSEDKKGWRTVQTCKTNIKYNKYKTKYSTLGLRKRKNKKEIIYITPRLLMANFAVVVVCPINLLDPWQI